MYAFCLFNEGNPIENGSTNVFMFTLFEELSLITNVSIRDILQGSYFSMFYIFLLFFRIAAHIIHHLNSVTTVDQISNVRCNFIVDTDYELIL